MIIPKTTQSINIGDKVIIIKEIEYNYFIITVGHEFDIIGYDKVYGNFICEDKINNLIVNISKNALIKKIDLEIAEKEYILDQEIKKYKSYIFNKCPNTDFGYSDRERYNTCKLKKGYNENCDIKLECSKFLKQEDINQCSELVKHLRKNKLDKLKNE